jgi:hypothetical protein
MNLKINKPNILINLGLCLVVSSLAVGYSLPDSFYIVAGAITGLMFPVIEVKKDDASQS